MKGEFWADDSGELLFADGDIGDLNHEAIALDFLCRRIFDALDFPFTAAQEEWCGAIEFWKKDLRDFLDCVDHHLIEYIEDQILQNLNVKKSQDPEFDHKWLNPEILHNAIHAAFNFDDPKLYMVQHEDWIRILDNNLETWKVTEERLDVLATAIYNIEGRKPHKSDRFVIESRGENICYNDVPYSVLHRKDMQALQKFKM
jgi:hypothetical protein